MLYNRKVGIASSKHIDLGMYGSDRRFLFTGTDGRTYIEGFDFDNGMLQGKIQKEDGKLFFYFMACSEAK